MVLLWEFLFPAMFFIMVGFFVYSFRKGVKEGYFQKGALRSMYKRKKK